MHYIPKLNNNFSQLSTVQLEILNSDDLLDLFSIIEVKEKVEFKNKLTLLQYNAHFTVGLDKEPVFNVTVDKEGNIVDSFCDICNANKCHHRFKLVKIIQDELTPKLEDKLWCDSRIDFIKSKEQEEHQRLEELKLEKVRSESLFKVSSLLDTMNKQDIPQLINTVRIVPEIVFSEDYLGNYSCELSLKLGIDKLYSVGSCYTFLNLVKNNEEKSYGKQLSFRHSISSFNDFSQKLLNVLIKYQSNHDRYDIVSYNGRDLEIDLGIVEEIFSIYQGQIIEIWNLEKKGTNDSYLISSNTFEIGFELTNKYNLKLTNLNNEFILDCPNKSFIVKNKEIFLITYPNSKMRPLYSFVRKEKDFSFKYIKDTLSKEVLARFYDHVKLDDNIKEEFTFKDFNIESYFHYEDDKITLKTKYLYDEKEILESELFENKYTGPKVDKYNLVLKSLGVENNIINEASSVFLFFQTDLKDLREVSTVYLSDKIAQMQTRNFKPIKMNLSYQTDMLSIVFEDSEYSDEELYKIIKGLKKKTKYIKLNKNTIIEVDDESAHRLLNTIDEFNLDINSLSKPQDIPLFQILKLAEDANEFIDFSQTENLKHLLNDIGNYKSASFEVPKELENSLRSYQKEAFLWMKTLIKYGFSGILADDMGLGKTLEMISVIISDKNISPTLIVCPKSLCYNWKNEFELWAPNESISIIVGNSNERQEIINDIKNDERKIFITSYDSLRGDIDLYKEKSFQYMIIDEGQFIKNHDTLKAQSVKNIKSKIRFALTGTPIENTVIDLWSIFDFLMSGYLGNISDFKSKFERSIIEKQDSDSINSLVRKISPFILRRTKEDVIKDLPEKEEIIQAAKMTEEQRKVYDAELLRTRNILKSSDNKIEILACLTRLRQVCVDPGMYIETYSGGSGKVSLTLELIEEYIQNNHRILLFSQFTSIFSKIKEELEARGIDYYILTGKTSAFDRVNMATEFNENIDKKVFLVSLKAGGTGLNLIGADVVIHLDPWWNIAAENQATDRAHRIGQTKTVQVIKLVSEDSIEQKVIELQERKKEIAKLIVADDDSNIQKLTKEDLSFLLSR